MEEKSLLLNLTGELPLFKIIDFLLESKGMDFSKSDIAEGAEIGRTTLFRIFDDLIKSRIIVPTRQIGNAKLFRLNKNSAFVKKMVELFDEVIMNKKKIAV